MVLPVVVASEMVPCGGRKECQKVVVGAAYGGAAVTVERERQ